MSLINNPITDNVRILHTVVEMLRDRGYQFPDNYQPEALLADNDLLLKMPCFNNKVSNTNDMIKDDQGTPIYVHILRDEEPFTGSKHKEVVAKEISRALNPAIPEIKPANKELSELFKYVHLLIIFNQHRNQNKRYDFSKFEVEALPEYNCEIWPKHRLRFNVTKHYFNSKFVILSAAEKEEYQNTFNVEPQHMQKYCWDDPIVRYYYGQPGQIFRIQRIQQGINYRLVSKRLLASLKTK
jgi:DNA-directed RNA polymerase subunit H (RpoH/RPB5)